MSPRARRWLFVLAALALLWTQPACEDDRRPASVPITILSPAAGEVYATGRDVNFRWETRQEISRVRIELSRDGCLSWETLATDVDAKTGLYSWMATGPVSAKCHARISDAQDPSRSAEMAYPFEIAMAFLSVVSPNGGEEKLGIGTTCNIRWAQLGTEQVKIELSRDGNWLDGDGSNVETIVASTDASSGSYAWVVTSPASLLCKVRITDVDGAVQPDESNGLFEIAEPVLENVSILDQDGGDLEIQDRLEISWTAVGVDQVRIDISREGGQWTQLAPPMSGYASPFIWTVSPGSLGVPQDCVIRVVSVADETRFDVSGVFRIEWDGIYRVKASAPSGGDGTTWQTAYRHPQDAMDWAMSGDEIWVGAGTYTRRTGDAEVLDMDAGVEIYGGFLGNEYDFSLRNPKICSTVLDGGDAAYHVVTGASSARLDGFTVTGGNATGFTEHDRSGAGMYNYGVMGLQVANCTFESNTASSSGYGGGMYNSESTVTVTGCTFMSNTAGAGGGAACYRCYNLDMNTFSKCIFRSNTCSSTSRGGGGLYIYYGEVVMSNCAFWDNSAYRGGGVYISNFWYDVYMVNCSLSKNTASYGGGLYDYYNEDYTVVKNTIIWGNTPQDLYCDAYDPPTATYSCLGVPLFGTGNISQDPMFRNAAGGDLHLNSTSPCRDAGDSSNAPPDDLDGKTRDNKPDMGCYEL